MFSRFLHGLKYVIPACVFLWSLPSEGFSKTIAMPLTLDYPFLRSLVVSTSFTDPANTAVLLDEGQGCRKVTVSNPTFSEESGYIRFETRVSIHIGVPIRKKCVAPITWDGYIALLLRPKIDPDLWRLSFSKVRSVIYDPDHKPAVIAGIVWKFVQSDVVNYLSGIWIDLSPPLTELKAFILPLFPSPLQIAATNFVDSMRPGPITISADAIRIPIFADMEEVFEPEEDTGLEELSEEELSRFIQNWETWDSFLVYLLTSQRNRPLSEEERALFCTVLLESRYRFTKRLTEGTLHSDFVREQFVTTWTQLSPVFRRLWGNDESGKLLGYLSLITASDALASLDEIGPSLGIEISRDGFIRLARLLADERPIDLAYGDQLNESLRKLLGLGPPIEIPSPPANPIDSPGWAARSNATLSGLLRLSIKELLGLSRVCWATTRESRPISEELRKWIVSLDNAPLYLVRVRGLLTEASQGTLTKGPLTEGFHDVFLRTVLATAWQESCWRQYETKGDHISYLRSYNGTSVGLMQINERVWRGIYHLDSLRWNIDYNVLAGCEILHLYLIKYLLPKSRKTLPEGTLHPDLIPRILYAMYNGGPGQFSGFLERHKAGKYYLSDTLFAEKYLWVKEELFENIRICLFGK